MSARSGKPSWAERRKPALPQGESLTVLRNEKLSVSQAGLREVVGFQKMFTCKVRSQLQANSIYRVNSSSEVFEIFAGPHRSKLG